MQLNDFNTLFGDVLRRAETSLQSNLQNVSLRLGTAPDIGGMARTVGSEVAVSYEALQRPKIDLDFILAHEQAHVAQKRLGAAPTGAAHLEDEADVIAAAILEGRSVTCYLADIPARPAFYEELGHYYTCYYVMLAAGVDPMGARIRAFFAQLPDEVIQFDATSATRDYNEYGEQDVRMGPMSALAGVGGFFSGIPRATPEY